MKTPKGITFSLLSCTLALALCPRPAQSQVALQFSNDGGFANGYTGTLGWQFTANQNLTLTQFGIYNAELGEGEVLVGSELPSEGSGVSVGKASIIGELEGDLRLRGSGAQGKCEGTTE